MSDPQIWTLIGVFAAAMLGGLSLVVTLITRTTGAQIAALGSQVSGEIRALDSRLTSQIESLDSRVTSQIEALDSRLSARLEMVDKEVAGIAKRVWGSNDA